MSKSVNRAYGMFCGCDYPKSKQAYVRFSNKKFRRYLKSDLDFECHDKAIYKKIGGVDWDYRGCRKHSKTKKFKKYKLDLFRFEDGTLNTNGLYKPIKYNEVVKVKDIHHSFRNSICKEYPKESVRFNLRGEIISAVRIELRRLYWDNYLDEYEALREELYKYAYTTKTTAHECFRVFHRKLQKYYLRKR